MDSIRESLEQSVSCHVFVFFFLSQDATVKAVTKKNTLKYSQLQQFFLELSLVYCDIVV